MRFSVLIVAFVILANPTLSQKRAPAQSQAQSKIEYICPMYCTDDVSLKPAKCPVCGMELEDRAVVENPKGYKIITPQKALEQLNENFDIVLLDVRSEREYNDELGHLANSTLIPIKELERRIDELETYKGKTIITYCSHGIRSARAAKLLTKEGFTVYSLIGGLTKWNRNGLPVVRE